MKTSLLKQAALSVALLVAALPAVAFEDGMNIRLEGEQDPVVVKTTLEQAQDFVYPYLTAPNIGAAVLGTATLAGANALYKSNRIKNKRVKNLLVGGTLTVGTAATVATATYPMYASNVAQYLTPVSKLLASAKELAKTYGSVAYSTVTANPAVAASVVLGSAVAIIAAKTIMNNYKTKPAAVTEKTVVQAQPEVQQTAPAQQAQPAMEKMEKGMFKNAKHNALVDLQKDISAKTKTKTTNEALCKIFADNAKALDLITRIYKLVDRFNTKAPGYSSAEQNMVILFNELKQLAA